MFGLLQHAHIDNGLQLSFRQSYCGTCKAIGKLYGQKERLFLNNDVVFLSELLADICDQENDFKSITVNNCFSLPGDNAVIPDFLHFTASVNVLLAYYKILDNIEDAKVSACLWKILKIAEQEKFEKASQYLESVGVPVAIIDSIIREQFVRESNETSTLSVCDSAEYYASCTAEITATVFKHGASVINRLETGEALGNIGRRYGEIVYMADAIEDYVKDKKSNSFNFLLIKTEDNRVNYSEKEQIIAHIRRNVHEIGVLISTLPIPWQKQESFKKRLKESLSHIIGTNQLCGECSCSKWTHYSLRERIRLAIKAANDISAKRNHAGWKIITTLGLPAAFILLFVLFPSLVHAQSQPGNEHTCCGNCCEGSCECCCKCCGCKQCCGHEESKCCYGLGDTFQTNCCTWSGCLTLLGLGVVGSCLSPLFEDIDCGRHSGSGVGAKSGGDSGSGRTSGGESVTNLHDLKESSPKVSEGNDDSFSVKVTWKNGRPAADVGVMIDYYGNLIPGGISNGRTNSDGWISFPSSELGGEIWVHGVQMGQHSLRSGKTYSFTL